MTNKPHLPTMGAMVVIVVAIVILYHFGFHKK